MAKFLGLPLVQYSSGDKLHTYEPGTTTDKASYPTIADAKAKTNALANPVVMDSRGEAAVVLAGNTKLVLKDTNDVTLWTQDNVNEQADVLDANGNEMVEYTTTASAVNHLLLTNAATGNPAIIAATGSDTNIGLTLKTKGTGTMTLTDGSDNELVLLSSVSSAINELTLSNSATGNAVSASATGGDTNIDLTLAAKGTGNVKLTTDLVTISGSSTSAAEIRLSEDTDNGTNYLGFKAPAALTASTTFTYPDGDGTSGQALSTDGSGVLSWTTIASLTAATQAEMEAATSNTVTVTPLVVQNHPGVAKAWINFTGIGTIAINESHNVTSITDNGTGDYTITIATDFASAGYAAVVVALNDSTFGSQPVDWGDVTQAVGSYRFITRSSNSNPGSIGDVERVMASFFGDQ